MALLSSMSWDETQALRQEIAGRMTSSVQEAAELFTRTFTETFESIVLARLFLVLPFARISKDEQELLRAQLAASRPQDLPKLTAQTRVLVLMGTAGRETDWNHRLGSRGHRVIALLDAASVSNAPMVASLLASLEVDLANLDNGRAIATRALLGGLNTMFYVPDAPSAKDDQARLIIPAQDFVSKYGIRTVFGMGGAYADGTLAAGIFFTNELLEQAQIDRFPSFISNFKMLSSENLAADKIYR